MFKPIASRLWALLDFIGGVPWFLFMYGLLIVLGLLMLIF